MGWEVVAPSNPTESYHKKNNSMVDQLLKEQDAFETAPVGESTSAVFGRILHAKWGCMAKQCLLMPEERTAKRW